jgi:carbamoyltransferase
MYSSGYILGIARGHNAGACLLKDGEIVFSLEEERLSRQKYDGGPYAAMMKVKEYTDRVDYIFVSHTQPLEHTAGKVDYTGDNVYTGLARKMGLIDRKVDLYNHPQVIDLSHSHHKIHAACAFYRSGFDEAVAVVVDGAGTAQPANFGQDQITLWETETIFNCSYPAEFSTLYKHLGCRDPIIGHYIENQSSEKYGEEGTHIEFISGNAGITKVYEAVTEYCGFSSIEAGKTMGLFPYGKPNENIPKLFIDNQVAPISDRNVIIPRYPNGAMVNSMVYSELTDSSTEDLTKLQNRRDLAYACQTQTQDMVSNVIRNAVKLSGKKKVVLSGGYALNCVANYHYLKTLQDEGIELYVEPISNDGGTAIGVALWGFHEVTKSKMKHAREIYLGPEYNYSEEDINTLANKYNAIVEDCDDARVVELMTTKNIVGYFQGRSENGPRALGNRSLLFDPTFKDGKDFVNLVKRREYFRPFAGSILAEEAHDWFDLRGMEDSPHMMYAVNCKEGVEDKIPSIIHVDGTCRIQTVSKEENPLYYKLIQKFKEKTGVPIVFNTSFNLGGEPLVETLEDALWTLQQSDIQYLYLPEYNKLITITNIKLI